MGYVRLKDVKYALFNVGKIIVLHPNENNEYTKVEEIKPSEYFGISPNSRYNRKNPYLVDIRPYLVNKNMPDEDYSLDVEAKIKLILIEDEEAK